MLDPRVLRDNPCWVAERLATRGFHFDVQNFNQLEEKRKHLQVLTQSLQNERNLRSKEIGLAKSQNLDIETMRDEVNQISAKLEVHKKNSISF